MPEVSDKAKEIINSLTKEEIILEKSKGIKSRFQNENFAYLITRLAIIQDEEKKQHEQDIINVSKEGNDIAERALTISNQSKKLAIWAIVISLVALIVQIAVSK